MKYTGILILLLASLLSPAAFAGSEPLTTGLFEDKAGFVDTKTGQKIEDAQNLMGYRYIAIRTGLQGSTVKDVAAFDENNAPITLGTPLNISVFKINGVDQGDARLKLWLKVPEGTSFKVKYLFK